MLKHSDLETLNKAGWGRVAAGDDLPPLNRDDARCIEAGELRRWLVDMGARIHQSASKVMMIAGFDIVDDLVLVCYRGEKLPPYIGFEKCRFRGGLTVASPNRFVISDLRVSQSLTRLDVRDSVVEKKLALRHCDALTEVFIDSTEIESVDFRGLDAHQIQLVDVRLSPGGEIFVTDTKADLLSLSGTSCDELLIQKGCSFDRVSLGNHAVNSTTLKGVNVRTQLSVSGSPLLKRLNILEMVADGRVDIDATDVSSGAEHFLRGCRIAGDLRISGSSNPDNQSVKFSFDFCEFGMDVISNGLRSAGFSFFRTGVRQDASFMNCSINQLAMTDSQVERDMYISSTQFEGPASFEEVKVGRRLDCYEVKQSAGFEETTEGLRSNHCFLANKSDFGEVVWRKCELGFKGGFTDCRIP
jgi:hypothetical protein